MKHIEFLGGRKFIVVVGAGIVNAVLLYLGKLPPTNYEAITLWTVGAFIAGNVWQQTKAPGAPVDKPQ